MDAQTMKELTVRLRESEVLYKADPDTGEMTEVRGKTKSHLPEGKMLLEYRSFYKGNVKAWEFLRTMLTTEEMGVVSIMAARAEYGNNSLVPLSDESSARELERELGVNKSRVKRILEKLYGLGVYAHVRVANGKVSEYWVLNPYIAWKGRVTDVALISFFRDTLVGKVCS